MSLPAVRIEGLWKEYRIGGQRHAGETFYDALSRGLARLTGRNEAESQAAAERFWALRDINLEIRQGEVVGIIGRNGAGKSTLLKILSRITAPTRGHIEVRGRLASLLEVGTGFHPELSGRENIFLNGAILGMARREIARKFDEIVAFAEVEKFIDTPVKRYSSGMYVRLAFAVAAHLDVDVLVVDEVLAVGDAQFQRRCISKMGDVAGSGRTILFVSHNMTAVRRLCRRAVWLDQGQLMRAGTVEDVTAAYLAESALSRQCERCWNDASGPGCDDVRLQRLAVKPLNAADRDGVASIIDVSSGLRFEFEYLVKRPLALNLSVLLFTSDDVLVLNAVPIEDVHWFGKEFPTGRYRCRFELAPNLLNAGIYRVELLFVRDQAHVLHREPNALMFEVHDVPNQSLWHGRFPGVIRPQFHWATERIA